MGLSPLSFDEAGRCGLSFDDKFSVTLESNEELGALVISAELGAVPEGREQDLCRQMLEGNYYWQQTGGLGTLALIPEEDPDAPRTAALLYQTPLQGLTSEIFRKRLTDFVDTAEGWIDYLSNSEPAEPSTEFNGNHPSELPESWRGGNMLRV